MVDIFIVDDHRLFRAGLAMILTSHLPSATLAEFGGLEDALAVEGRAPALILLDIELDGIDGLAGLALVRDRWPGVPVAMVSADAGSAMIARALAAGAAAFVAKSAPPAEIVAVVRRLLPGLAADVDETPPVALTPRQGEILHLVQQGLSNKRIASTLGISEFTVRGHVQTVINALGASSRTEAVYTAQRRGIL